jgi:uncharacterized protein YegP (UPF0339 family)
MSSKALPNPRFEVYKSKKSGKWHWRLISSSDTIADSGQGYASKEGAMEGIAAVKRAADGAPLVEAEE